METVTRSIMMGRINKYTFWPVFWLQHSKVERTKGLRKRKILHINGFATYHVKKKGYQCPFIRMVDLQFLLFSLVQIFVSFFRLFSILSSCYTSTKGPNFVTFHTFFFCLMSSLCKLFMNSPTFARQVLQK